MANDWLELGRKDRLHIVVEYIAVGLLALISCLPHIDRVGVRAIRIGHYFPETNSCILGILGVDFTAGINIQSFLFAFDPYIPEGRANMLSCLKGEVVFIAFRAERHGRVVKQLRLSQMYQLKLKQQIILAI
jgi:hypothetical protein